MLFAIIRHVVCMLAYRMPIVCSLLAFYLPFFSFGWLAECFRAVFMLLIACRSACCMLAVFVLSAVSLLIVLLVG